MSARLRLCNNLLSPSVEPSPRHGLPVRLASGLPKASRHGGQLALRLLPHPLLIKVFVLGKVCRVLALGLSAVARLTLVLLLLPLAQGETTAVKLPSGAGIKRTIFEQRAKRIAANK